MSIHLAIFGKPRYLGLLDIEAPFFPRGTWLVVETMRGSEIALLGGPLSVEQEARYRTSCNDDASDGQVKGGEPILQEISLTRIASGEDMDAAAREREEEDEVLVKARMLLRNHSLSMKLVDVEYLLDKKKLFFLFHIRTASGFSSLCTRSCKRVQNPYRASPDRRSRRSEDCKRNSSMRSGVLLQSLAP